jgi:valyl-tRNA synthetase
MDPKFLKPYNPKETEDRIYKLWEKSGFFNPDNLPGNRKDTFTILMPPTNANGDLHAGHGLVMTIEDIITRYNRMRGKRALWLPGTDHAGFETQVVYEKKLEKEGRSRFKMEPKDLYKEIFDFTLSNKKNIIEHVKKMGASCDWSREKFTLDEDIVATVYKTFKKLYDDGLLYRGRRIVNWCVKHQTSLSELETISEEKVDPLYYMKYGPFTLATVRPETKFGDTAIAVNPKDSRYKDYVGKEIEIDTLIGKTKLKVIADEFVDPQFGTGVVKVTPAHDPNDFEMGLRHNLGVVEVIDKHGRLNEKTGKYEGLKINEARKAVVEDLKKAGLLEKIDENYRHSVKKCYKCQCTLEPRIMPQWFVKMKPLAQPVIEEIEAGKIAYMPENYKKITLHWLKNINDWNISRQIVWGIPIPAKLCIKCDKGFADLDDSIKECPSCKGEVVKDADTFDTWFSSGQWPYAALGYPDSEDYKTFYPTDVMETAGDIIFFWVARMLMFGIYVTGKRPFNKVYIHGMVLDGKGAKMSKSKGNVINPMALTEKFGTDAFRMGMIVGNAPGSDIALSDNKIKAYKHFANKIWNITRFVLDNIDGVDLSKRPELLKEEEEMLQELDGIVKDVTEDMENYRFYLAGEKLYHYVWHTLADVIIEKSKLVLNGSNENAKLSARWTLYAILETSLKLLHPFTPFVTEEIWQSLPSKDNNLLMIESWPESKA